jgi:hypothetical protein
MLCRIVFLIEPLLGRSALLQILFIGIVGAFAFGLAFGLGGRDEAARMWREMRGAVGSVTTEHMSVEASAPGNGRPTEHTERTAR